MLARCWLILLASLDINGAPNLVSAVEISVHEVYSDVVDDVVPVVTGSVVSCPLEDGD